MSLSVLKCENDGSSLIVKSRFSAETFNLNIINGIHGYSRSVPLLFLQAEYSKTDMPATNYIENLKSALQTFPQSPDYKFFLQNNRFRCIQVGDPDVELLDIGMPKVAPEPFPKLVGDLMTQNELLIETKEKLYEEMEALRKEFADQRVVFDNAKADKKEFEDNIFPRFLEIVQTDKESECYHSWVAIQQKALRFLHLKLELEQLTPREGGLEVGEEDEKMDTEKKEEEGKEEEGEEEEGEGKEEEGEGKEKEGEGKEEEGEGKEEEAEGTSQGATTSHALQQ